MQTLQHVIIPGQSVMLAHLNPTKMNKRMLRSFIEDKNMFQPLLAKYFEQTELGLHFTIENIYDSFPQEDIERWMLHLIADTDISPENLQNYNAEAMVALQKLIDEMLPHLPGDFDKTIYENLMPNTKH
jgi:hypothetical protein